MSFDLVPYATAGIGESPCENVNSVSAILFVSTIDGVITVSDHMKQNMGNLSCVFGSVKKVGAVILLASSKVLKNLAAAGESGKAS